MSNDEGAGAGTILVALAIGAVVGAAVALLFAPQTGEETREMLSEKTREGRKRAAEFAEKAAETFNQGREQVTNAFERGKDAYQQAKREKA